MYTKRVLRIKAAVAVLMLGVAAAQAWDSTENQVWLQASAETRVGKKVTLKMAEQYRYKDSGGDAFYHHTDLQVGRQLGNGWSLAGTYRYIDKERKSGEWKVDNMGILDLCKKGTVSGVELKGRLRGTYTDKRDTDSDPWEIRTRLDIAPAKAMTGWKLKPYVADELMLNLNESNFYRNRAYIGLKTAPHTRLSTDVYLMQERQESAAGDWNELFVMGGCVALKF